MKLKFTFFLLFLCYCSNVTAQDVVFYNGKKDYIPAQIVLTNGKTMEGYIKDFTLPKFIQVRSLLNELKSYEERLNLDRKSFSFKYNAEGESSLIHADSIQKIILKEDKPVEFEKMKLKTVNSKNKLVDTDLEVFLPLIEKGKINLYGLNVVNQSDKLVTILAYIKKPEDNFAVVPVDMSNLNIFNAWTVGERFLTGFSEITKDCDAYQAMVQEEFKKMKSKDKQYLKDSEQKFKDFMIANCNNCNFDEVLPAYYFQWYKDMISKYSDMCN